MKTRTFTLIILLIACLLIGCKNSNGKEANKVISNSKNDITSDSKSDSANPDGKSDTSEKTENAQDAGENSANYELPITVPSGYVSAFDLDPKPYVDEGNSRYDYVELMIYDEYYVFPMSLTSFISKGWGIKQIGDKMPSWDFLESYYNVDAIDNIKLQSDDGKILCIGVRNILDTPVSLSGLVVESLEFFDKEATEDFVNTDAVKIKDKNNNWVPLNQVSMKDIDSILNTGTVDYTNFNTFHIYKSKGHSVAYNINNEENNADKLRSFSIYIDEYSAFSKATLPEGKEFIYAHYLSPMIVSLSDGYKPDEVIGPMNNEGYIEIMGKKYQIPFTVSDLINSGDFKDPYTDDETVAAGKNGGCYLAMSDSELDFRVTIYNNSDKDMNFMDCLITEIWIGCIIGNDYVNDPELTICGIPLTSFTLANALEQYKQAEKIAYEAFFKNVYCTYDEQNKDSLYEYVILDFKGQQLESVNIRFDKRRFP